MPLGVDLASLLSGLTADASEILLDQPGAGYDQLHALLERLTPLPLTLRGRIKLVGAVLVAKRFIGGSSPNAGPIGRFVATVADDAVIETLKRIIEYAPPTVPAAPPAPGESLIPAKVPLARHIDALTHTIAPWMGR